MPPVLRANVGGAKQLEIEGATVGEVLDALVAAHPGLRDQLFTPDGDLNRFVNVYVNDQDIRYLQERATPVEPRGYADPPAGHGGRRGQSPALRR